MLIDRGVAGLPVDIQQFHGPHAADRAAIRDAHARLEPRALAQVELKAAFRPIAAARPHRCVHPVLRGNPARP